MSVRGFRDRFRDYTPAWLQNTPGLNVAYRTIWMVCAALDVMMEAIIQGRAAAFPGLGTPTALPLIGSSRGIRRGIDETDESYALRLRNWLDTWENAGADAIVLAELQAQITPLPKCRIVARNGHWTTLDPDGTVTVTDAAWDWDGNSNPERNDPTVPCWSDYWIIVYSPPWAITGTSLAALVGLWGTHALGCGHAVPRSPLDAIVTLVAQWKGAHTRVRCVIWSYDATLFDPANPASLPDGWWGHWSREDPGNPGTWISSRDPSARYWIPFDPNPVPDGGP
jgi:hypothetical protein